MKPQTILLNVIFAIALSAAVLVLLDAGDAPPASERANIARQDSMVPDSTERGIAPGGNAPRDSTKPGNKKTGGAQPGSTRASEPPSQRPPIADTMPDLGPVENGLAGIMGGEGPGGAASGTGSSSSPGGSGGRNAIRDARDQTSENLRKTLGEPKRRGQDESMSIETFNRRADTLRQRQQDNLEAVIEGS